MELKRPVKVVQFNSLLKVFDLLLTVFVEGHNFEHLSYTAENLKSNKTEETCG